MKRVSKLASAACVVLAGVMLISPTIAKPAQDSQFLPATRQAETPWKTVAASGSVQSRPVAAEQAVWEPVGRGDELSPRTLIETGKKSRATLTRNASLLLLDPSSRVELPGDGSGRMETSVVQTQGSVMYKVDSRSNPHFEVVTPFLVAGVKGTSFLVTVNEDYASIVVESGRVEVTNPGTGETMMIGAGESIMRHTDELRMDLVSEGRASRAVRRETRLLKHMRRANDEVLGPVVSQGPLSEVPLSEGNAEDWVNDSATAAMPGTPAGSVLTEEVEDVTNDLIQELIREEIGDGVIRLPNPGVVDLPTVPPGRPTIPGDAPDGPGPDDISELP